MSHAPELEKLFLPFHFELCHDWPSFGNGRLNFNNFRFNKNSSGAYIKDFLRLSTSFLALWHLLAHNVAGLGGCWLLCLICIVRHQTRPVKLPLDLVKDFPYELINCLEWVNKWVTSATNPGSLSSNFADYASELTDAQEHMNKKLGQITDGVMWSDLNSIPVEKYDKLLYDVARHYKIRIPIMRLHTHHASMPMSNKLDFTNMGMETAFNDRYNLIGPEDGAISDIGILYCAGYFSKEREPFGHYMLMTSTLKE